MAELSINPASSYDIKLNFWEEFPTFKLIPEFGAIHRVNKGSRTNLKGSSRFMWALSLLYDRKSVLFNQPLHDKLEAASENIFDDTYFLTNLIEDPKNNLIFICPEGFDFHLLAERFQRAIDSPLGISLRELETKLQERTRFIMSSEYTLDRVETDEEGNRTVFKSNVEQLDKMLERTTKINDLILNAMNALNNLDEGETRGGSEESLTDSSKDF